MLWQAQLLQCSMRSWDWVMRPFVFWAQSVTLLTYRATPPLRLPCGSWRSGVTSSAQLLPWRTSGWTSSCWGLHQHFLLYHLHIRASGNPGEDETYGFSTVLAFAHTTTTTTTTEDKYCLWFIFQNLQRFQWPTSTQKWRLNGCKCLIFTLLTLKVLI